MVNGPEARAGKISYIIRQVHNLSDLAEQVAHRYIGAFGTAIQNSSPANVIHQARNTLEHPPSVEIHVHALEVHLHYGVREEGSGSKHTKQNLSAKTQPVPPLVDNNFEQ